jgi:carbon monoxide dehydrogenase subunit G
MTRTRVSVDVDAPPEKAWKIIADPRNLPKWDRHIINVAGAPRDGLSEGSRYTTEIRFMGVGAKVDAEVLEMEPPRHSKIRLKGFMDATVETTVEPLGNGKSRIEHVVEYRFRGGPIGKMAATGLRLTGGPQLVLRRGTLAQKRQVEKG